MDITVSWVLVLDPGPPLTLPSLYRMDYLSQTVILHIPYGMCADFDVE